MALLHAGVDTTVIALWLGHEQTDTTMIYLHADLTLKEKALDSLPSPAHRPAATDPPTPCWPSSTTSDRRRPPDYAASRTPLTEPHQQQPTHAA